MKLKNVWLAVSLLTLGACSSWYEGVKNGLTGSDPTPVADPNAKVDKVDGPTAKRSLASIVTAPTEETAPAKPKRQADPFDLTGPANEGSLWSPDSQEGFYFSKNILHKAGDILIVKIEPEVNDALNLKIASALNLNAPVDPATADPTKTAAAAPADKDGAKTAAPAPARGVASVEAKPKYVEIDDISVRIAELLPRNTYRIEGTRRVFIKTVPYTLHYSGIVRDEDLNGGSTVASAKVLDSKMEMTK